jgi:hypothetical protein
MSEEIDGIEVDLSRLPPDLQPLAPLIRRWASGDDEERSKRLAGASVEELREPRDAPAGSWDFINAYLDENVTIDEPYEAIVLDYFSQAAMEAHPELQNRGAS